MKEKTIKTPCKESTFEAGKLEQYGELDLDPEKIPWPPPQTNPLISGLGPRGK